MNQLSRLYQILHSAPWARPHQRALLIGGISLLGAGGLAVWLPTQAQAGLVALPGVRLDIWGVALAGLLAQIFLNTGGSYLLSAAVSRVITDWRRHLFARLLLAPQEFHDEQWAANLVAVLTTDMGLVQEALSSALPALAQHIPITVLALGWLFWHNPLLTLCLTVLAAPGGGLLLLAGQRIRHWMLRGQTQLGWVAVTAQESFQEGRAIKFLAQEAFFERRMAALTETLLQMKLKRLRWTALTIGGLPLVAGGCLLGGVGLGYWQWQTGQITWSDGFADAAYLALLASGGAGLVQAYTQFASLLGAAQRVAEVSATLPSPPTVPASDLTALAQVAGQVAFEQVTFAYPAGGRGVFDLSFTLGAGEFVALTGPNGSGKSTLIQLLLRLYEPHAGQIFLDTHPAATVALMAWRRAFAVVTRDPAIFSLSVAENIALSKPGATLVEIEAAARATRAHDFIQALPGGYHARLGEGGLRLSAGQRQRLALARLFLQDPAVIILDEALTSLDRESEQALVEAFTPWLGKRTFILVSHQPLPATLQPPWRPTRVLRLEAGRLSVAG